MNNSSPKTIYQVSELTRQIQQMLEASYRAIWVEAEISSLSKPASGHWYFSLKDNTSQIRCAMFRNRANSSAYQPKDGDLVRVRGKVTVYAARGDMQMIIEHIEAAGEGELQRQFEQLKNKLHAEGLFAQSLKKSIPKLPKAIGLITSPSGAAIQDILTTARRRFPCTPFRIYPSIVQGSEAPSQLIQALQIANSDQYCDVLVLSRGGGSLEDLWCFNDEGLVRAIVNNSLPVVSAVGHEVDITLSDLAADLRAPTPTAAAEIITLDQQELFESIGNSKKRIERAKDRYFVNMAQNIDWLSKRIRHPSTRIDQYKSRLVELRQRIVDTQNRQHNAQRILLRHLTNRLKQTAPTKLIQFKQQSIAALKDKAQQSLRVMINQQQQKLRHFNSQLTALSYERTLDRGYAIIKSEEGKVLTSASQTKTEKTVQIIFSDGKQVATLKDADKT